LTDNPAIDRMREVEIEMSVGVGAMSCQKEMGDGALLQDCACGGASAEMSRQIMRLQVFTLIWMVVECALALFSAWRARSSVLLAFGADSLVELLSALVVLLQFVPRLALSTARATRLAGILLFILAAVITLSSALALWQHVRPETSLIGMGVTLAALAVMPLLSSAKRRAGKTARNAALTADAVQSATCAYLAGITLAGLVLNAVLHIRWIDPAAALVAVPVICLEGKKALQGKECC
jgi:divalent metal cation (Fe/Co/Zn/Cd) transporter